MFLCASLAWNKLLTGKMAVVEKCYAFCGTLAVINTFTITNHWVLFSAYYPTLLKVHYNALLPSTSRSSEWYACFAELVLLEFVKIVKYSLMNPIRAVLVAFEPPFLVQDSVHS